jgi:hypothetical protein
MSADSHSHDGAGVPSKSPRQAASAVGLAKSRKQTIARRHARVSKTGILITGMHRSGTSALARVFNLLGCDLPSTLMPAGEGNEPGHWESLAIAKFNDEALASAGLSWADWLPFGSDWSASPSADQFRERAVSLLEQEFAGSRLFVLKDPRICRLLPFWLSVLEAGGYDPAIVIPTRNPLEVAASLAARDGMHPNLGQLLWLRYVLEAERSSRGRSRFYCSYDHLLHAWPQLVTGVRQSLGLTFSRMSLHIQEEIETFLGDKHRHHRQTRDSVIANPLLSTWVRDTYDILDRWCTDGEQDADHATLDRVLAEFDAAAPAFARPIAFGLNAASQVKSLDAELDQARAILQEKERLTGEMHTLQVALTECHEVIQRLTQERDEARTAREDVVDAGAAHREILRLEAEARDATDTINDLREMADSTILALDERDRLLAELRDQVSTAQHEAEQRQNEIAVLTLLAKEREAQTLELAAAATERDALVAEIASVSERLRLQGEEAVSATMVLQGRLAEEESEKVAALALATEAQQEVMLAEGREAEAIAALERAAMGNVERDRMLAEQRDSIAKLLADAAEREVQIASLVTSARENKRTIAALVAAQAEARETLEGAAMRIVDRDRALAELGDSLARLENESAVLADRLQATEGAAADLRIREAEVRRALEGAISDVAERDRIIADIKAQMAAMTAQSEARTAEIATLVGLVREGEQAMAAAAEVAAEQQLALEASAQSIAVRDRQLADLQGANDVLENLRRELEDKRSQQNGEIIALSGLVRSSEAAAAATIARLAELEAAMNAGAEKLSEREAALASMQSLVGSLESRQAELFAEIAELSKLLKAAEASAQGDAMALSSLQEEVGVLESVVFAATTRANESEADMQQVSQYFARKNAEVADLRRELDRACATMEWTRQVAAVLLTGSRSIRGRLFLMLPGYASRAWVATALKKRGLFDSEAYLKANPDVASSGANPIRHFVYFGLNEGRKRY